MADKKPKNDNSKPQGPEPVKHEYCPTDGCKKPAKRMAFCEEHFQWFKEGLVNKRGERPSDFDKKYQAYMRKKAA
jgi:hypothetical protein